MQYTSDAVGFLAILAQVILPIIVAVVTKTSSGARWKAVALLGLTALTQFLSQWADGFDNFDIYTAGMNAIVGLTISIAIHYGVWKPSGASSAAGSIGPQ